MNYIVAMIVIQRHTTSLTVALKVKVIPALNLVQAQVMTLAQAPAVIAARLAATVRQADQVIKFSDVKQKSKVLLDNTVDQVLGVKEGIALLFQPLMKVVLFIGLMLAGLAFILLTFAVFLLLNALWSGLIALPIAFVLHLVFAALNPTITFQFTYMCVFSALFVINCVTSKIE